MYLNRLYVIISGVACLAFSIPTTAAAVDGVIEINQVAAFAGGITPGDTPGFPVTLSQSGSYRLTGNLDVTKTQGGGVQAGAENITAILVLAQNVTIDLNGFAILGPSVCSAEPTACSPTGSGNGVSFIDGQNSLNTTVRNGSVSGMGGVGLELGTSAVVERVRALRNGGVGISVSTNSRVADCTASFNGDVGILGAAYSVVSGSTFRGNAGAGVAAGAGSTVVGNASATNNGPGIAAADGSTVTNNSATSNNGPGLQLGNSAGYGGNVVFTNIGTVSGGVQIGTNLCNGSTVCP